ncbi:nuclear transport factor 2 family protein [Halomonas sp. DP5Y7-2]|uniref:nuclear transport factor 2 family protein n=1 Tax=Halomonas sp. DP5Y7-2 TaxID=2859076 RepID=UPI001C993A8E|nr:nuclear transport factor 2 family protein [Halomonas sp. DP5Y7-2]MBY5985854.1 nuclear transport factor 2 family protein [Halomonas sp. DP5Y7-2]
MIDDPQLAAFCDTFNKLDKTCTEKLYSIYSDDIVFIDPLHRVNGINNLKADFDAMYANVITCQFDFRHAVREGQHGFVTWTMTLQHRRLARGKPIAVEGCSALTFASGEGGKVIRHQDYFDAGALLYERLPLVGMLVRRIKRIAAG